MVRCAEVCNKAALIASDCGLPDLALTLCWRQYDVFDHARPLPATAATLALQPLLNLPRQMIRQGQGHQAHALFEELYQAARDRTDAVIVGRSVNLRDLISASDDHKTICTMVWAALLADGTRALALAGRWREAADQAAAHRGVGTRLLDGRQAAVLALVQEGQADHAAVLIEQSAVTQPWEQAVQSLLRVLCQRSAGADSEHEVTAMLTAALALTEVPDPSLTVFRTRVGMTALDLADGHADPQRQLLGSALIEAARQDAHAARDVLAHPQLDPVMTASQRRDLNGLVHTSGLGIGTIHDALYDDLIATVASAEQQLRELVTRRHDTGVALK
ncbi:hypothetical protein PZB75_00305 [Streptomyces sp. AM 4-1-1]|uniref:hypothetical protein n=1 Tax=Streptomyces sp. AM 4-1-1 TaxID=3028710 RepID=UPI0023B9E636|nr:hypothetical protein [Streptomyces sp. AM 4-1-1]WEH31959.1 hypothetical protein PZB75_00305 [Streptomyces sp. AM 4-1-1]